MPISGLFRRRAFTLADNPVYHTALRQIIRARAFHLAVPVILAGCAYPIMAFYRSYHIVYPAPRVMSDWTDLPLILCLLPLCAAVATAAMAVRDHDDARADMLRLTDLTLTDIAEGRFFAALAPMLLLLVVTLPFIVVRLLFPPLATLLVLLLLLSGFIACGAACGLNAGAANREYAIALIIAVSITPFILPLSYLLPVFFTFLIIVPAQINLSNGELLFHAGAGVGAWLLALLLVANSERRLEQLYARLARHGR